jgi:hypothetical protein
MKSSGGDNYKLPRMIPPGIHRFFFSINGTYSLNPYYDQVHLEDKDILDI